MVTFATLCYLRHGNKILLQRKAQGLFGEGRWNAPGGKMLAGELPEKAAVREMLEETGHRVSSVQFNGILNFYLGDSKELDQAVFVFSCKKFTGKMRGSSEGELRWFSVDAIPIVKCGRTIECGFRYCLMVRVSWETSISQRTTRSS